MKVPKIAMAGPLAAGPLGDIAGSEQLPMRPITPDAAPAADRPVATFHQLSPPMLNIGALPSGNLPAVRSEGALYTGVLASQPIRPQEVSCLYSAPPPPPPPLLTQSHSGSRLTPCLLETCWLCNLKAHSALESSPLSP